MEVRMEVRMEVAAEGVRSCPCEKAEVGGV